MKKALLVLNGERPSENSLRKAVSQADLVVGVDGGSEHLLHYNITPNLFIGDSDSVKRGSLGLLKLGDCEILEFNPHKDFSDCELAINEMIKRGCQEVSLIGAGGGRLDHTLFNLIFLLNEEFQKKITLQIIDEDFLLIGKRGPMELWLNGEEGSTFSIVPFSEVLMGFEVLNSLWEVEGEEIKAGQSRTLSNQFKKEPVKISIQEGTAFIYFKPKNS